MSERNYRLFLQDILDSILKMEKYTKDIDFKEFRANDMIMDAVIRNFEIIGEATTNIPDEIQKKHPSIPWKKMRAMRNIVIHEYFGVDYNIAWRTIKKSLPPLKVKIIKAIKQERDK